MFYGCHVTPFAGARAQQSSAAAMVGAVAAERFPRKLIKENRAFSRNEILDLLLCFTDSVKVFVDANLLEEELPREAVQYLCLEE